MYTLAIVGCGYLAEIITNGIIDGLLPEYQLIASMSRSEENANRIANKINRSNAGYICHPFTEIDKLLEIKPDFIVETASPKAFKSFAVKALKNGSSIITLSIGAFADKDFYDEATKTAKESGSRVYIASGAIGGFDVLRTVTLMGNASVTFSTEKSPNPLIYTPLYTQKLQHEKREVFKGNAVQAIAVLPTQVNVSVAASIASVGPEKVDVSITSTPGFVGDRHKIHIKNEEVDALIDVYSSTPEIAAWSVIETLQNIISPIVF